MPPSISSLTWATLLILGLLYQNINSASAWTSCRYVDRTSYHPTTRPTCQQLSATTSPIMEAYELDNKGKKLQQRGALNAAVRAFSLAASLHPTDQRHFRLGVALEANGEPSRAIDAYNQARNASVDHVLRHDAALKIAHIWAENLGDLDKGCQNADAAMAEQGYTDSVAAKFQKAFFLAAMGQLEKAISLWDQVLQDGGISSYFGQGADGDAKFFRAIAQELTGQHQQAQADLAGLPHHMVESWRYVTTHPPHQEASRWHRSLFDGTYSLHADALSAARPDGLVCEFGVFHGMSIRNIASMVGPDTPVHGFDTFEGIPEDWGDEPAGSYTAAAEVPERVPDNVRFYVGLFADSLPGFVASLAPPEVLPARFVNIDCDLYQGTVDILHNLAPRIGPGTVIVFDEYLMTPTWPEDEYRAFQEACTQFGWEYEYLAFSLFSKQAVVRITKSASFVEPACLNSTSLQQIPDFANQTSVTGSVTPIAAAVSGVPMDTPARQSLPSHLRLVPIPGKGLGVVTTTPIPAQTVVGDYKGEVMTAEEKDRRYLESKEDLRTPADIAWAQSRNDRGQGMTGSYLYEVSRPNRSSIYIDGENEYESSWTRFVNHAPPPIAANLAPKSIHESYNGKPRVWLVSNRDIEVGEELCFDYGNDYWLPGDDVI